MIRKTISLNKIILNASLRIQHLPITAFSKPGIIQPELFWCCLQSPLHRSRPFLNFLQGSSPMVFGTDLDNGTEGSLTQFVGDIKLGGEVDTSESRDITDRLIQVGSSLAEMDLGGPGVCDVAVCHCSKANWILPFKERLQELGLFTLEEMRHSGTSSQFSSTQRVAK